MRRVLLATLAATALVFATPTQNNTVEARQPRVVRTNTGFFGRMMEAERRKNEWLRARFLGR